MNSDIFFIIDFSFHLFILMIINNICKNYIINFLAKSKMMNKTQSISAYKIMKVLIVIYVGNAPQI